MEYKINTSEKTLFKDFSIRRYVALVFAGGMLFPLSSWLLDFYQLDYPISISGLVEMHGNNNLHYLIDLAPFVLAFMAYRVSTLSNLKRRELEKTLHKYESVIETNTLLAKQIGEGDLSVDLSDINQSDELAKALVLMRENLISNTEKESEQNWIAKGKEKVGDILRSSTNLEELSYQTLVELVDYVGAVQGAFYIYNEMTEKLENIATYAYNRKKYVRQKIRIGQGLVGQVAYEKDYIYRKEIPDEYMSISSGLLGDKKPKTLLIVPLLGDEKLQGIVELASLDEDLPPKVIKLVKELSEIIAQTLFNLKVNKRTQELLEDSQDMTRQLKKNEEALRKNAKEMEITQKELEQSNERLETQIREVENAQKRLYSLLENASEVISIYDDNQTITYESPSVFHILGYKPEEVIKKNAFSTNKYFHYHLKDLYFELLKNPGVPKTIEFAIYKNIDEQIWLETTGRNLLNNPAIQGIIFNTRDITVRKIAEKAQRMSGEMQALSENSPDMIARLSPEGKFFYANPVVERYTGLNNEQIIQKKLSDVDFFERNMEFFTKGLEIVTATQKKSTEETTLDSTDGERMMQINVIPEFNSDREMETILFVAHDITERKQIEIEIEAKNKSITESINYAQRIQSAILPNFKTIQHHLPNSFMFYRPRDVVSGDIPWFFERNGIIYIAVVDCTGHGVPGALLSFISYFTLNSIVDHDVDYDAGQILDLLHAGVRKALKQDSADANARDGMDIALCKIDYTNKRLDYAGAHRPLYRLGDSTKIIQYKGNRQAIGGIPPRRQKDQNFENHEIQIIKGDKYFFFSDGLPDQIGGPEGKKYQANRIRSIIENNKDFTMEQFNNFFVQDLDDWQGNQKQIDDILLIGIEI